MKKSNFLLWFIIILFIAFALWIIFTGKLDALSASFVDGIWKSIENLVRPVSGR